MRPPHVMRRGAARSRVSLLLSTVLLAVALTACGSSDPEAEAEPVEDAETSVPPRDTPSESEPQQPPREREDDAPVATALDFEATTVDGETFEGASVAGQPVVLWFWAPWCAVCRSQVPMVTDLSEQYGEDLAVLGVGSLDSEAAIAGFADDAAGITHLSDPDGELWKRFGIAEQSSFVVLDSAGEEVLRTGYGDDDAVEDAVADVTS